MLIRARYIFILIAITALCTSALGKEYTSGYWFKKGSDFLDNNSLELALDCFNKSLEQDSKNVSVLMARGIAFSRSGRSNEAIQSHDEVIGLNPGLTLAWHNKGLLLARMGRYNESLSSFDRAIELDPRPF